MAKGQYQIPFINGNLCDYASGYYATQPGFQWKDNYIFDDELEYISFSKGRSSVQMNLRSTTDGRCYNMSIADFSWCILQGLLIDKKIKYRFTFAKKGTNYMLVPYQG